MCILPIVAEHSNMPRKLSRATIHSIIKLLRVYCAHRAASLSSHDLPADLMELEDTTSYKQLRRHSSDRIAKICGSVALAGHERAPNGELLARYSRTADFFIWEFVNGVR